MRNLFWLLFVVLLLSCSRGEQIQVRGIVGNGDRQMIFLDEQGLVEIRKADSAKLQKDGSFVLKDRIKVPTFYNLHTGNQNIIPLLLQPGERAEITTDLTSFASGYELNGSQESLYLLELNKRMARTRRSLDSLSGILEENPDTGEEKLAGIRTAYDEIMQSQRRFSIEFVLEHMNSIATIYALYQKVDDNNFILNTNRDIQLLKITSMALDTLYPESEYVQSLRRDAANLEQGLYSRKWQSIIESAPSSSPDIRLPDPYGDTITLSSLKGKVVLLSFWASWDQASVSLNRDFKNLYAKYHNSGLEIYQVSFDRELSEWRAAIQFDELPWINVSELNYPESSVASLFNVTELPAFYLIGRHGEITGKDFDRIALDRKISVLINQN